MICLTLSHAVPAQGNAAIVGDWRRVSVVQPDSVWAARLFWGPKPLGMIHYSAKGLMAAQLYDEWCPTQGAVGAAGRCESTPPPRVVLSTVIAVPVNSNRSQTRSRIHPP